MSAVTIYERTDSVPTSSASNHNKQSPSISSSRSNGSERRKEKVRNI